MTWSSVNSHRLTVLLVLALLCHAGCSKKDAADSGGGASAGSSSASGSSSSGGITGQGDKDAVAAMRDELAQHWLQTPDGWYSEFPSQINRLTGKRAGPESFYRQFKELKFTIDSGEVSDSDKLNGIQYRGTAGFENAPVRVYGDPNAFGPPKWGDWHPTIETVDLQKKNGKWIFGGGYMIDGTKPSAATIATLK